MFNKKIIALSVTAGCLLGGIQTASALDQDIQASIITKAAIAFSNVVDMDFALVEFAAVHSGDIQLGTNGTVVLSGTVGLTASGVGAAGSVDISGDGASTIDITCETGGTLTDAGVNSLLLSATEITAGVGGAPGTGTACGGLGIGPISVDLSVTANPTVLMGGTINVDGNAIATSDTYSTALAGGNPVTLRVVYQ